MLKQYDRELIESWKESITFQLIFVSVSYVAYLHTDSLTQYPQAGLFSAVLTAFIVVSFPLLQSNLAQETNLILLQISAQLSNGSGSVRVPDSASNFQTASSAIAVNSLWLSSLVFSLGTASIAILVMKWFQEYLAQGSDQVRESTRIRQFRYDGLKRWRVDVLMSLLPLLLHISLVLFFAGLIVFLWTVEKTVASIVTILIGVWEIFWVATIALPSISKDCPYKSTEALAFFSLVQYLEHVVHILHTLFLDLQPVLPIPTGKRWRANVFHIQTTRPFEF